MGWGVWWWWFGAQRLRRSMVLAIPSEICVFGVVWCIQEELLVGLTVGLVVC
mgnify:CR=1 FL=1